MSPLRPLALLPLVLSLLSGCDASSSRGATSASVRLALATPTAEPGSLSRVTLTLSAPDMTPRSTELVLTDGVWGGVLTDLPAGEHRTVLARALTASGDLAHEARVEDITLTAGAQGLVSLSLRGRPPSPPLGNQAPLIDSLGVSATTVDPGGSVSLTVSAHDPNPGDTVSYSWTADRGSFSAPTQATTTWTAPDAPGTTVYLVLAVSDSRGATFLMGVPVRVSAGNSAAEVTVDFNAAPQVMTLSSTQSALDVGQTTLLSATASDAEGDTLSYRWSATCPGTFTGEASVNATFTPSARPEQACNNCQVSVVVEDGRGGRSTGALALCVSKATVWQRPASWALTGSLSAARHQHTATLLSTGRVLVAGGVSRTGINLGTSELYDPATGRWSAAGALNRTRSAQTVVLLSTGRVLITGGSGTSGYEKTAEVYDPATGRWTDTGAMTHARVDHQTTMLANGRVLVTGGRSSGSVIQATAEVYDPATGTWSLTGAMGSPRLRHTATRLLDGRVLVAGGANSAGTLLTTAELYDPATGTWSPTGAMPTARDAHPAVLLPNGKVLVAGGNGNGFVALLYDPATGTWSATQSMTGSRAGHTLTLLPGGKVLAAGGSFGDALKTVELYDPATGTWSPTASLTMHRRTHTETLLPGGRVLVTGGYNANSSALEMVELYDPGSAN